MMFYQFSLEGNRLEHPENPQLDICLSKEAENLLEPEHRRWTVNGCAATGLNHGFVFIDNLFHRSDYEGCWDLNCIHCDKRPCGLDTLLEFFLQTINEVTIHELIHLCTPQNLTRNKKKHEKQVLALTALIYPTGCGGIVYGEAGSE